MSNHSPRYLCIHGHFYQPPRENPWLEAVEVQDSAAPYHDWNERITRECYAPNSQARLLDRQSRIAQLVNNYSWISFNFGPTLLQWMDAEAPDILANIVAGDRLSRQRHRGHGNALAQVYNHVIMPLAGARDKQTQVRWGVADFRRRFGRDPEGMWLAETAVDTDTLEALAAAGIRFTVLAPRQARRWRRIGDGQWTEIPDGVDPSRPYLCRLPSGRSIALFFYDGILSRQVAFEGMLDSGERFASRLLQGFDDSRPHAQLMHIATDGESYGHHHAHGDMALAYALQELSRTPGVRLTNYGEFLELHPPEWEAQVWENSSWSCAHGVERWRAHCGCASRSDWQQHWRQPLREAFDWLKHRLDQVFAARGRECFPDPWAARDGYIDVVLDRSAAAVRRFLRRYAHPDLPPRRATEALRLLEMQRHGMLMYTSCGWFFDEVSGLETTQCLRYAARAVQLARHFGTDPEGEFVARLERAPSNLPQFGNGRGVWEQLIRPGHIGLERVLAHHAIRLSCRPRQPHARFYCYELQALDQEVRQRGDSRLAVGRLGVRSTLTGGEEETCFVTLYYGGLDFHTVLRPAGAREEYEAFKRRLLATYTTGSLADVTDLVAREFDGQVYRLDDLFAEEKQRVIDLVLQERFAEYQQVFERLADRDRELLSRLSGLRYPIPQPLGAAASVALDQRLREEIKQLGGGGSLERLRDLYEGGRSWGYRPGRELLRGELVRGLRQVLGEFRPGADLEAVVGQAHQVLDAADLLGVAPDLWHAQNQLLEAQAQLARSGDVSRPEREAFAALAARVNVNPDRGWAVGQEAEAPVLPFAVGRAA